MTDRWAAVLASGKIRITVPPPAGRTLSEESRARKSPRNTLKRFKTGSEIGHACGRFSAIERPNALIVLQHPRA